MLNTSVNSTGTVTLYGIQPDANGEVTIGVAPGTSTSQFGLLGSLVVGGYNAPTSSSAPSVPVVTHATERDWNSCYGEPCHGRSCCW